jgi:hypothetical protein
MRKLDLSNPETDVEELGREFAKWISNGHACDLSALPVRDKALPVRDKMRFDISDVHYWFTGNAYGNRKDAYMLVHLWEECGLISKTDISPSRHCVSFLYTWKDKGR